LKKKSKRRQFKGTKSPPGVYTRHVTPHGYSRSITVGRIIPEGWRLVNVQVLERNENSITIKITKLAGLSEDAHTT